MALVPQEVILFGGSIYDNIRYGKPDASDEEIRLAAKDAFALDFIEHSKMVLIPLLETEA